MSDFRFDKLFLEPFIAVNEDDEEDVMFGWHEDCEELPENFIEGDEEEIEYFYPVKNLTSCFVFDII